MKIKQTRDVLDTVIQFHKNLAKFYDDLGELTQRHKLQFLLNHMARHEKHLMAAIERYEAKAPDKILDTWLPFAPTAPDHLPCEHLAINSEMTANQVVNMVFEFDACIIELFEKVHKMAESDAIREVFGNLLELERNSLKHLATETADMVAN